MNDAKEMIQKGLRRLAVATVAVYLALASLGVFVWVQQAQTNQVAVTTNRALCALRQDLEGRVEVSRRFLEENPDGIPGIPAKTLRDSIANQQRTILALAILNCPVNG
jgi:hypothetical protein